MDCGKASRVAGHSLVTTIESYQGVSLGVIPHQRQRSCRVWPVSRLVVLDSIGVYANI